MIPDYTRGIIVMKNIDNVEPQGASIYNNFIVEVQRLNKVLKTQQVNDFTPVKLWRQAFRSVGIKSEYKPSFESLLKRVSKKPSSFKSINPLVDLGNYCSLKLLTSIGVHPINNELDNLELCFADGTENFIAFGKDTTTHPYNGEVVLRAGNSVLTRNWVWRQGELSMITSNTKDIFINVDCLGVSVDEARVLTEKVAKIFHLVFDKNYSIELLHHQNTTVYI